MIRLLMGVISIIEDYHAHDTMRRAPLLITGHWMSQWVANFYRHSRYCFNIITPITFFIDIHGISCSISRCNISCRREYAFTSTQYIARCHINAPVEKYNIIANYRRLASQSLSLILHAY